MRTQPSLFDLVSDPFFAILLGSIGLLFLVDLFLAHGISLELEDFVRRLRRMGGFRD